MQRRILQINQSLGASYFLNYHWKWNCSNYVQNKVTSNWWISPSTERKMTLFSRSFCLWMKSPMVANCMLGCGKVPCEVIRLAETRKSSAKSCRSGEQFPFTTGFFLSWSFSYSKESPKIRSLISSWRSQQVELRTSPNLISRQNRKWLIDKKFCLEIFG